MKILHTSDWHVGKTIRGRSRIEEHAAVLHEIAQIARDEAADLILVAGDLFDSAAPAAEAERLVYRALLDLAGTGATVAVLAGNHDSGQRLQAVQPLLELGSVVACPVPAADATLTVTTKHGERARLVMMPWIGKHYLVRAEQVMELDAAEAQQEYEARVRRIIGKLCQGIEPDAVNIMAAHCTIVGAQPGEEVRQAHVFEYAISATVFPPELHYVALGHFHTPQAVPAPCPAWYSGSPLHLGFGSAEVEAAPKGVVIIDASPGRPAEPRLVELTSGRKTRTIRGSLAQLQAMAGSFGEDYLRVFVTDQARAGIGQQVREWFPEAVDVRVEPQPTDTADTGVARAGRSPHELFVDYLGEKGAMDERVIGMFDALVEEAHAADPA